MALVFGDTSKATEPCFDVVSFEYFWCCFSIVVHIVLLKWFSTWYFSQVNYHSFLSWCPGIHVGRCYFSAIPGQGNQGSQGKRKTAGHSSAFPGERWLFSLWIPKVMRWCSMVTSHMLKWDFDRSLGFTVWSCAFFILCINDIVNINKYINVHARFQKSIPVMLAPVGRLEA